MIRFWRYGWLPLLLVGLFGLRTPVPSHPGPFGTAYWYWHHPFRLAAREVRTLQDAGVERLYVHAGTVALRRGGLRLEQRQHWAQRSPLPLFAVLRVQPAANEALLRPGTDAACAALLRSAQLPPGVAGVQLDADMPSVRLPEYAAFLRRFRCRLPQGWKLSITALPDWIQRPAWISLRAAVDEIVPQFYGNRRPVSGRVPPLWEAGGLLRQVRHATRGSGGAVWVGLPRYGRCVLLAPDGRPTGLRHDLDPALLLDDPGWAVSRAAVRWGASGAPGSGSAQEDTLVLRAEADAVAGPLLAPRGATLWFQWPCAEGLAAAVAGLRRQPEGAAGVCYFRLPAPDEPLGLPPPSGSPPASSTEAPLRLQLVRHGGSTAVTVANDGRTVPLTDPGIRLEVWPAGGQVLSGGPVRWTLNGEPVASVRADRAVLSRRLLWPGRSWEACEFRGARGPVRAAVHWRDGLGRVRSVSAVFPLMTAAAKGVP